MSIATARREENAPVWSEPGLRRGPSRWEVTEAPGNIPKITELELLRMGVHADFAGMRAHALNIGQRAQSVVQSRKLPVTNNEVVWLMGCMYDVLEYLDRLPAVLRNEILEHKHVSVETVQTKR